MAGHRWTIDLGGATHTVEIKHNYVTGRRFVKVDGEEVEQSATRSGGQAGSRHSFMIGRQHCEIVVTTPGGVGFDYDLLINGRPVDASASGKRRLPVPRWGWALAGASALIPPVMFGGLLTTAIAFAGAGVALDSTRDGTKPERERMARAVLIAGGSWAVIALLVVIFRFLG